MRIVLNDLNWENVRTKELEYDDKEKEMNHQTDYK